MRGQVGNDERPQEGKTVRYIVNRWHGHSHYHVTFYDLPYELLRKIQRATKFNTQAEAEAHIRRIRQRLRRAGIRLQLTRKDYCM